MSSQTLESSRVKLYLPSLNAEIVGNLNGTAVLFKGVQYANVEQRWSQSRLCDDLISSDATTYGPRCPQIHVPVLSSGAMTDPVICEDEFRCLNLNIAVPQDVLPKAEPRSAVQAVPVLVWLHGGSFIRGSNSVARYHPQKLVELGNSFGKPVVIVQINYRLGPFGFAASNDLAWEYHQQSETRRLDHVGNYGLLDQRNAFLWVEKHIRDFGGDPSSITAVGISAGSASLHHHILSGTAPFDRAVLMSGTAGTLGPLPFNLFETEWQKLASELGTKNLAPADRLEVLRNITAKDLVAKYSRKALGPCEDPGLWSPTWSLGDKMPQSRCKDIIVGDTQVEGIILDGIPDKLSQETFRDILKTIFSSNEDIQNFCVNFGFLTSTESLGKLPHETYKQAFRLFFSVAVFQFPTLRVAETFGQKLDSIAAHHQAGSAYLYHFEEPSPWKGPSFGLACHGHCATYLYLNQMDTKEFPDSKNDICRHIATLWINFAYGEEPWQPYQPENGLDKYKRFGPNGISLITNIEEDTVRPQNHLLWTRANWNNVQKLCRKILYEC